MTSRNSSKIFSQGVLVDRLGRLHSDAPADEIRCMAVDLGRFFDAEGRQYSVGELARLSPERIRELGVYYTQV
jgi:hypothetical protein